jgi:hypothetical protein
MDNELLLALIIFWLSTTITLFTFLPMWFMNGGAAFHPHSVSLHQRHSLFMVVSSETQCKKDFAVSSISAFVAPRGSTTSKYFAMLCTSTAIAGVLGSYRWFKMGDAQRDETICALLGFLSLLLVAGFELDVSPHYFLQVKLMVTKWLIEKQVNFNNRRYTQYSGKNGSNRFHLAKPFPLNEENILKFVRKSPLIYGLYEEDHMHLLAYSGEQQQQHTDGMTPIYGHLHMLGAIGFVVCVTTSVVLNDSAEAKVGFITGTSFLIFSFLGYLTGGYIWLIPMWRGVIMVWNPFLKEPQFMAKLQRSVTQWIETTTAATTPSASDRGEYDGASEEERKGGGGDSGEGDGSPWLVGTFKAHKMGVRRSSSRSRSSAVSTETKQQSAGADGVEDDRAIAAGVGLRQRKSRASASARRSASPGRGTENARNTAAAQHRGALSLSLVLPIPDSTDVDSLHDDDGQHTKKDQSGDGISLSNLISTSSAVIPQAEADLCDLALDNFSLRLAREQPQKYLHFIGRLLVMSELIALLTPCVAVGIQWITALCPHPPVYVMLELTSQFFKCLWGMLRHPKLEWVCNIDQHCIMRGQ